MKYTFDRVVRLIIGLSVLLIIVLLIDRLSAVLLPFVVGWLLAYLIYPLVKFIRYKMKVHNKGIAIFLALLFISILFSAVVVALVPAISKEIGRAIFLISDYLAKSSNSEFGTEVKNYIYNIFSQIDIETWTSPKTIQALIEKLLPQVFSLLSSTWQIIVGFFVIFVVFLYVVFILKDYEEVTNGFRDMIPLKYRTLVEEILDDLEEGMNKYFRGQGLVALIVGILFAIGFRIIGLPLGITIGLFIGLLNLVPYLQTIGIVPVVMLAMVQSAETGVSFWVIILECFIVFIIVQSTQDLFLVPKIMGKAMGLNPAVILLSLSVWGSLFGLVGMIIALPCTTILISYYRRFVLHELRKVPDSEETNKIAEKEKEKEK